MKTFSLLVSTCLLLAFSLNAGEKQIVVNLVSEGVLQAEPRKTVTCVFSITNNSSDKAEITSNLELPHHWMRVAGGPTLQIQPHQEEISLVSFLVPRNTPAGTYSVRYMVESKDATSAKDTSSVRVVVEPITRLSLETLSGPEYVVAGEPFQTSFALVNQGNVQAAIHLNAQSHTLLPVKPQTQELTIMPGETQTVEISVQTDSHIRSPLRDCLTVSALSGDQQVAAARATRFIEVIPRITSTDSHFYKIPTEAACRHIWEKDGLQSSELQGEILGSGTLHRGSQTEVAFVFRGPDVGLNRMLGRRDEYFLKLWSQDYYLTLGDDAYSLSPLMENHCYGRGIRAGLAFRQLSLGTYHMKARWSEQEEQQTATYMDYSVGGKASLGLNYLRKSADTVRDLFGLEASLKPLDGTTLELEYSQDVDGREEAKAYRLRFLSLDGWGSCLLRLIHAGRDYPGYFSNVDFVATALRFDLTDRFLIHTSLRQERHSPVPGQEIPSTPEERDYQVRLEYRYLPGSDLSLAYKRSRSEDRSEQAGFHLEEESVRAGINHGLSRWDWHLAAERGMTYDRVNGGVKDLEVYTASLRIWPYEGHSYYGYLQFQSNGQRRQDQRRSLSGGINVSLRLASRTMLDIGWRSNDCQDLDEEDRDVIELGVRQQLSNRGSILIKGHYAAYRNQSKSEQLAVTAEYRLPFGLPVERKEDLGALRGRVYDEETGEALPEVILRLNGATAVSDRNGSFVFPSVKAGTYHLSLDRSTVGLDRIPRAKVPIEVRIEGGKKLFLEIGIVRGAAIRGQILLYGASSTASMAQNQLEVEPVLEGGVANALVEINDGLETRKAITDHAGFFEFEELRPGKWRLSIDEGAVPQYYAVQYETIEFELGPAEEYQTLVKVVPRPRPVHILQDGGTLTERKDN